MYRKTSPQQKLFGIETQISASLRSRLESSWAQLFRLEVLPILFRNEDRYAMLYGTTGRPNFSVARLLGLCLLQEWNDMSDQQALDTMSFALSVIDRLDAAGLKPETLFADGVYPSVPSALKVKEQDIEFMAPVNRSRLSDDIMGRDLFRFTSEGLVTECPLGHSPIDHRILSGNNTTRRSLYAIFDGTTCRSCEILDCCPVRAPNHRSKGCHARDTVGDFRLEITPEIRLRDEMYALQQTTEWKNRYKIRAGIEATNSELKRIHGIGRLRVRRIAKVCFAVACKIIACNIKRWARALSPFKSPLHGCISSLYIRLNLWPDIMTASLFKKQVLTTVGAI